MQRFYSFLFQKSVLLFLFTAFPFLTSSFGQDHVIMHQFRPTADSNIINPELMSRIREFQPHITEGGQQNISVKLMADRNPVQIAEPVKFTAVPGTGVEGGVYRFFDEKGKLIPSSQNNECYYHFTDPGAHLILVSLSTSPPVNMTHTVNTVNLLQAIDTLRIQVDSVALFVDPVVVEQGKPVSLETRFYPERGLVYRFIFGDNFSSDWSPEPSITHIYPYTGIYTAYAEIGIRKEQTVRVITRSIIKQITVFSPPPPPPDNLANVYVKLNVDRPEAKTGEVITFAAISNIVRDDLQYMFYFGDKDFQKGYSSSAEHIFTKRGYYTVSVKLILEDRYLDAGDSVVVFINPSLRDYVTLKLDRLTAAPGESIRFIAGTNSSRPDLEYIFNTGSQDQSLHSPVNTINYTYNNSGSYNVFVQLASNGRILATSEVVNVSIVEPAVTPWWIYAAGALVLGFIGYQIKKIILVKPSFYPHPGQGNILIEDERKFNITCEIHFIPNSEAANYTISNEPIKEIRNER